MDHPFRTLSWLCLVLLLILVSGTGAQDKPKPDEPKPDKPKPDKPPSPAAPKESRSATSPTELAALIEQLGAAESAKRNEARKKLEEASESALELLRQAARKHKDPDVRLRAGLILAAIQEQLYGEIHTFGPKSGYWINRVAFLPGGKQCLATGGAVIVFDLAKGTEVRRVLEKKLARRGLDVSSDGTLFLTGHEEDKVVHLGEVNTGKEVQKFEGHTAGVRAVALSPDGTQAVSGGEDGTLRLWDTKTGKEIRQFRGITDQIYSLTFSPDGKQLLSGHGGPDSRFLIRLWDVATGKAIRRFAGHEREVTRLVFLVDGPPAFLSSSMDGTIRLWALSGAERNRLRHSGGVYDLALSKDGKQILSAGYEDKRVCLWDLNSGELLHVFDGHQNRVLCVAFSPDGKQALSGDAGGELRLWRLQKTAERGASAPRAR